MQHQIVSHDEWLAARKQHLAREKELTRRRDQLSAERRELPWVKVDKPYVFDTPDGKRTLADLFDGRSQLIVYHFMFGPGWTEGCKSCSFLADHFNGAPSTWPSATCVRGGLAGAVRRDRGVPAAHGLAFPWVSSSGRDFNRDYRVSFTAEELAPGDGLYNYDRPSSRSRKLPGAERLLPGTTAATSTTPTPTYARGLDISRHVQLPRPGAEGPRRGRH